MIKKVKKPWGSYEVLLDTPKYKVKRITINPSQSLSYQYHGYRHEHWFCVEGWVKVIRDDKEIEMLTGESMNIRRGQSHRAINTTEDYECVFIEIQTGDKLDEDDIIRIEDKYGRERND